MVTLQTNRCRRKGLDFPKNLQICKIVTLENIARQWYSDQDTLFEEQF